MRADDAREGLMTAQIIDELGDLVLRLVEANVKLVKQNSELLAKLAEQKPEVRPQGGITYVKTREEEDGS